MIRITRGNPSPEEEAAIRAAILKTWREDTAAAMRGSGESPWVRAGRLDALASRSIGSAMPARRTGVGGAK
ncbi:MAG: hypothetical protein ACRDJM_00805 [Actinomycetota bacterium]